MLRIKQHSSKQEGNWDPALKPFVFICLLYFSTQMNVCLPFEGHNVAYYCNGLGQSNSVCEYEVNLSTNEMVITEKQKQC